jgi:hypothetical protein
MLQAAAKSVTRAQSADDTTCKVPGMAWHTSIAETWATHNSCQRLQTSHDRSPAMVMERIKHLV